GISAKARDWFASHYQLNEEESEKPFSEYPNIATLFIRHLKKGARPIDPSAEVVSPVDGVLSQTGVFDNNSQEMIQAKGKNYDLASLLRSEEMAKDFEGGFWATIYLAPFNYHRIHTPVSGSIVSAHYCPGRLWPVNLGSVERVEGLFAINERLTTRIKMADGAEMLVVKVGATNVGRIALSYKEDWITNSSKLTRQNPRLDWFATSPIAIEKGSEMARFEMGSTVILIGNKKLRDRQPDLFKSKLNQAVQVGQSL
ncbi:MAG TPA: archaetidylserine decarboxylase, partial [Fibrobacteraceae bacterium]|nr:archaetidylserine decarboxylase [Fibrobacteraceae bacterium]